MKKQRNSILLILFILAVIALAGCGHEHTFGDWRVEIEPSCTEEGTEIRSCQCGEIERRNLAMTDHTDGSWVTEKAPTCAEYGIRKQRCVHCTALLRTEALEPIAHVAGEWIVDSVPSCTEHGIKKQQCVHCAVVLHKETLEPTAHVAGEWIVDTEPTTTQTGVKIQKCTVCHITLNTQTIPVKSGIIVILDAGHGGADPGEVVGSVQDKHINLQIACKMKELLEASGITVIMTREDDSFVSLEDRARSANDSEAAFFVSVHCNSYDDNASVSGFEVYYYQNKQAKSLAAAICSDLEATGQLRMRGVKTKELYVIKNTTMPAILLEMGFLTNEAERQKLCTDEYQQMLAEVIASRIARFLTQ